MNDNSIRCVERISLPGSARLLIARLDTLVWPFDSLAGLLDLFRRDPGIAWFPWFWWFVRAVGFALVGHAQYLSC